jgi:NAD(P)-dependent dehydrogenase (short-subunit alcohol dehydrogenase family)
LTRFDSRQWALVLGGSSGFGLAAAQRLAADGMSIALVHRDRKGRMEQVNAELETIRRTGARLLTFNADALDPSTQQKLLNELAAELGSSNRVRLLLHSIALGNLKPLAVPPASAELGLEDEDFAQTVYAMGTSIASWTRQIFSRGLFAEDARVLGLTSEGSQLAWPSYAAVSAAKAALEAVIRAMAVEYGPHGLRCNVLQPGVTDTPALRLIPGCTAMLARALQRNPLGRLTTPSDVAAVVSLMCSDEARFINGVVLRVDGGEAIAG